MKLLVCALLFLLLLLPSCFGAQPAGTGGPNGWNLAWEDSFDRADVGPDWQLVGGKASIENGRLLLKGGGATILVVRTFKPDVRFEFDAEAWPGAPPCDLSATIGANPIHGYGYLLAFGGQSNQANQLLGRGVRIVDRKPKFLIEHGKKYHIIAQEEGKRITYTVNGVTILDAVTTDLAAGPGFDRIGLVTWNGMYVDDLKVYERAVPHPDTPDYPSKLPDAVIYRDGRQLKIREGARYERRLDDAVDPFNDGRLAEAAGIFDSLQDRTTGLIGRAYVVCDLAYDEKLQFYPKGRTKDFQDLADAFRAAAKASPSDTVLAAYSRACQSLPELIMCRAGMTASIRLAALGPENNPFYHKARLYEARYRYWNGMEGGNEKVKQQARGWMAELKQLWPENVVLRQYTGEKIPWGEELIADTERHPAWASYLREAYARNIRVMERFFTERQAPDGQLGGGYGDDVELMRTWMQIAAINDGSEIVREGIECLSDGIWKYELKNGYAKGIGDIEHSAEPSADSLPTMLLVRYGDPVWVERNLMSCKTIRNVIMGIDKKGYPRFKSSEFGAAGVRTSPRAGGDTGYHARAMKHYIWQAWWGDQEAKDWFVRWCDGWRAATMAEIDGKIVGFAPPTIWYPSGDINPPVKGVPWHDDNWNYYGNMGGMVHDSLLCAYYFSRDPKFLKPFQLGMDYSTLGPLRKEDFPKPTRDWQLQSMLGLSDPQKIAIYKWLTGERVYDEYTLRFGDPAQNYRVDHDLDRYMKSFEQSAKGQRHNLELQTTEVLSTDRAALGGALTVFGAYTGAVCGLRDAATPTFAVTYDAPTNNFAALVTEATSKRLRVRLYNFEGAPQRIGLRLWQLVPGKYILNQGATTSGEFPFQNRYLWTEPTTAKITHRADKVWVNVPPGKEWVVDLRLDQPIAVPKTAPDLAISARDIILTDRGVQVTVHNIGNAASKPARVRLSAPGSGREWKTLGEATVPAIPAPKGFAASTKMVLVPFSGSTLGADRRVTVDPNDQQYELCETNNSAPPRTK